MCDEGRGSLPFSVIHGEALVAVAAWALERAEVEMVDEGVPWSNIIEHGGPVVLHDPLCPMTPPEWIAECVAESLDSGAVVIGVRPVTDTLKEVDDGPDGAGELGETVDRDGVLTVCSPIVLPADLVADLPGGLPTTDFVELTAFLRERRDTRLVPAPAEARRVGSAEDVRVLAALTAGE